MKPSLRTDAVSAAVLSAVLIPLFLLGYTYSIIAQRANPPGNPRDAHPSPPLELTYKDEVIGTMQDVVNPFRHYEKDDPEAFKSAC